MSALAVLTSLNLRAHQSDFTLMSLEAFWSICAALRTLCSMWSSTSDTALQASHCRKARLRGLN